MKDERTSIGGARDARVELTALTVGDGPGPLARLPRGLGASPWPAFLLRRLAGLVVVLVALAVVVFFMVRLIPGDPAIRILGFDASPARIADVHRQLGLDGSLGSQFVDYVGDLARGDLGHAFYTNQTVGELIAQRIGSSLELAGAALALVILLAVPIGLGAAALTRDGRHRRFELGFTGVTSVAGSVPDYLVATILAFLFAVEIHVFPVAGDSGLSSLVLPAIAVSLAPTTTLARIVRVETLNVLQQDYVRVARSKRLPARRILLRHVLPNVLTATLTVCGLVFAGLIGGAVIVENVFNRNGVGTALVGAVVNHDYAVVQGITLVLGVTVVVVNALVDVLLGILDPRSLVRRS
jgi:peptide/nickel transport system permease protein